MVRFNEFWSINKIKYLNLACLLITILCLATIITLSGNNNNSVSSTPPSSSPRQPRVESDQTIAQRAKSDVIELPASESLVAPIENITPKLTAEQQFDSLDDEFDTPTTSFSSSPSSLRRRKSEPISGGTEREVEDTTPLPSTDAPESSSLVNPLVPPFMGPILNQIFNDIDIGGIIRSARQNASAGDGHSPIIHKQFTKNGATVIISSGAINNSAEASSLLDKLLPPFLRPFGPLAKANKNGSLATATITMKAEPLFALATGGPGRQMGFDSLSPSFPMQDPPLMFSMGAQRSPFFEPSRFKSSMFHPMMTPVPEPHHLFHPGGLLSMIMRASELDPSSDAESNALKAESGSNADQSDQKQNSSSSLSVQASQQHNINATGIRSSNSSSEPEVELVDVMQKIRSARKKFAPRLHNQSSHGGSILVFSSTGAGPMEPSPISPLFMPSFRLPGQPNPQLMLIDGAESSPTAQISPLNPILRTILSNVISDLSEAERNKTDRFRTRSSSGVITPAWNSLSGWSPFANDVDQSEEQPSIDRWDEQTSDGRFIRMKHRSNPGNPGEDNSEQASFDSSDMISGMQMDQSPSLASVFERQLASGPSGIVSGAIRQTIRGPGMTVERIIELPTSTSGSIGRLQQVASGLKSQSLSRFAESDTNFSPTFESPNKRSFFAGPSSVFRPMQASDRSGSDSESGSSHMGFISRLLADLGQKADHASERMSPLMFMRARMSSADDLDEADSSSEMPMHLARPRLHSGNARIRLRPLHEPVLSSADSFLLPPAHFTILENNDDQESSGISHLARPAMLTVNESKQPNSAFEETLNSVEDRLSNVLSLVSHDSSFGNSIKPIDNEEQSHQLEANQGSKSDSISSKRFNMASPEDSSREHANHNQFVSVSRAPPQSQARIERVDLKQVANERIDRSDNPFTSPTSPLFGFPTSSMASQRLNNEKTAIVEQQPTATKPIAALARSFQPQPVKVYPGMTSQSTAPSPSAKSSNQLQAESVRERVLSNPPAMIVMGRRFDDKPISARAGERSTYHDKDDTNSAVVADRHEVHRSLSPTIMTGPIATRLGH